MLPGNLPADVLEQLKAWEASQMEKRGWFGHMTKTDLRYPYGANYHTHGLETSCKHLDFQLLLPVEVPVANVIFGVLIDKVKEGHKFQDGDIVENVINGYSVKLIEVTEDGRPVLRIIIPDANGSFDKQNMEGNLHHQYTDIQHS